MQHRKVSKYYENDSWQIFVLFYKSLLTDQIVKNSHAWARIYFMFPENVLKQI